ncbi:unnamed protein product [Adineta ricciae]|uniref:Nuclear receptor domain-containing protein n=1 Tax=Adineta ricciae TaxID=249248 RepID=A0A813MGJ4_ADIRI|nr:unnamed protein product [Adineta ricciae]CAF1255312.1 unnamed protein product [Adineta ricciae]
MENDSSYHSNSSITCLMFDTRALCVVCGAPAIGRNFDAYTCLSCKAFFRRNAYNDQVRFTCRSSSSCEITTLTRRHCSACRLNKCFRQGMKKELIRSLVAIKQATSGAIIRRSHRESQSPLLTTINHVVIDDQSVLSLDDWNLLSNIQNAYEEYCVEPFLASHERISLIVTTQPYRTRIKLQRLIDLIKKYYLIVVSFIKHVLEFDPSTEHDYIYIQNNLRALSLLNVSELMKCNILKHAPWEYDRCLFELVLTEDILQRFEQHLHIYQTTSPHDAVIIKLFLISLAFSSRIYPIFGKDQYHSMDFYPFPQQLVSAQNYYITLLWKYVIYRLGIHNAIIYSARFIQHFLRQQMLDADVLNIINNRDDHGQLVALIRSELSDN